MFRSLFSAKRVFLPKMYFKVHLAFLAFLLVFVGCQQKPLPRIPMTGLQLWLKADQGVTLNGSTVSKWADQSGNSNDAFEVDEDRQPLLVRDGLNGKPTIRFDGFNDKLGLTGSKRMSQISLFIVFKIDSGALDYVPIAFGDMDADGRVWGLFVPGDNRYSPDTINIFAGFSRGARAVAPRCAAFGVWHTISVVTNGVIWSTTLRANGMDAQMTHDPTNMFISVPIGNPTGTGTGGIAGNDAVRPPSRRMASKCDIAEVILYDTILSDSSRRSVERYLAATYGLSQMVGAGK